MYAGRCFLSVFPYCLWNLSTAMAQGCLLVALGRCLLFAWPPLLPSTHKGSSFPVQLNPCLTLWFLQFLFGPCSFAVTTQKTQPRPLPAALTHVTYSLGWLNSCMATSALLAWWSSISPRMPSQCFTDGELLLPGANFSWCSWALISGGVFSCRRLCRQHNG